MNVVKVEKTHPCLKVGSLRSRRPHTVYSRMKRPVAPLNAVLKDLNAMSKENNADIQMVTFVD